MGTKGIKTVFRRTANEWTHGGSSDGGSSTYCRAKNKCSSDLVATTEFKIGMTRVNGRNLQPRVCRTFEQQHVTEHSCSSWLGVGWHVSLQMRQECCERIGQTCLQNMESKEMLILVGLLKRIRPVDPKNSLNCSQTHKIYHSSPSFDSKTSPMAAWNGSSTANRSSSKWFTTPSLPNRYVLSGNRNGSKRSCKWLSGAQS